MAPSSKQHKRLSQSGSSRRSKPSSGRYGEESAPEPPPPLSFLFVINELRVADVEMRDHYHHQVPPMEPNHYTYEIPSLVMRYENGNISAAEDCQWYRPIAEDGSHLRGSIYYPGGEGGSQIRATFFRNSAVFACNPLLPVMVCPEDPYCATTRSHWQLLQIVHPHAFPGVSQVAHEDSEMGLAGGLVRYIASSEPSWMPSLVPSSYRWPYSAPAPAPGGLGGELSIILGLMALTAEPDPTNQNQNTRVTFLGSPTRQARWRHSRWTCSRARGHPSTAQDIPRGFLVSVFLDPRNPLGSTEERLLWFQWNMPIVTD